MIILWIFRHSTAARFDSERKGNDVSIVADMTSAGMKDRYQKMRELLPDVEALSYLLGPDKALEWLHSIGVATDEVLRGMAPPIPPTNLRSIVAASSESVFLWTGIADSLNFINAFNRHRSGGDTKQRVLDFGCGCGRMTRFFGQIPGFETHGTDINVPTVTWCQANLASVTTKANGFLPPLDYTDNFFDLVYSLSIFTHLPEQGSQAWLAEIARILAPGGVAVLSTHGKQAVDIIAASERHHAMFRVTKERAEELRDSFASKGFQYIQCDPETLAAADAGDDYGHSFTHENYIREVWPQSGLQVVEFIPGGVRGWQDIVVLKKPL